MLYKLFISFFILTSLSSYSQEITYPPTIERPVTTVYHDTAFTDPYQWLEQIERPEVRIWQEAQNEVSLKYLQRLSNRHNSENLMNKYMNRDVRWNTHSNIRFHGGHDSFYRLFYNNQFSSPAIYHKKNTFNDYKLLVDPRYISNKDLITVREFSPSKDDRFLAYIYSRNGSDWGEIRIKSTEEGVSPKEVIRNVKFSDINWYQDGFLYKSYPFDSITGANLSPKICYHKLFTPQSEDSVVFASSNPLEELWTFSSRKEDMYIVKVVNEETGKKTYMYFDPSEKAYRLKPLFYKVSYAFDFQDYRQGRFIALTVLENKDLMVSFTKDAPHEISIISPNYKDAQISHQEFFEDKIAISYQSLSQPFLTITDLSGNVLGEVANLPKGVTISDLVYQKGSGKLNFTLQSYTIPPVFCELDPDTYEYKVLERTGVSFDYESYKFSQEYFTSKDGTEIPVFIVYKDELRKDGSTPFLLKAYGGFGAISAPRYDPLIIYFIEQGGAFAFVNTRGGGELGQDWWQQGRLLQKQNTFDDFVWAARYLIGQQYTEASKIGITGTSHGGLVAAAALTQAPDLFGAAVLDVAPLDMLRFENFTVGTKHLDEFGSVKNEEQFRNLLSYSPYQHLNYEMNYPPTLIVTSAFDDRVPPLHSFKFAAAMQNNPAQKNPSLLWVQEQTGHAGASTKLDQLEEKTLIAAFLHEMLLQKK